jgi:hypothetical protein
MTADVPSAPVDTRGTFFRSFFHGLNQNKLVYSGFVVVVMAVAGFIVSISSMSQTRAQNAQLQELVACQNRYNEINNERTRQLSEVTDIERAAEAVADAAFLNFTTSLATNESREKQTQKFNALTKALDEQQKAREIGNKERDEHPVPPPPTALCGS